MSAERLYRLLLDVLLPRDFRREAERDMVEVFRAAHGRADGVLAQVTLWTRLLADLAVTTVAERTATWRHVMTIRPAMRHLPSDLAFAVRRLARTPAWTLVASGTLALGLAAASVSGVLMRDVILDPLPFPDADRLVRIIEISDNGRGWWPSYPNARDWRDHARVLEGVGIGTSPRIEPLVLGDAALRVPVARAAIGFFETLRVAPAAGRLFHADDNRPGAPPVAVVTDRFWRGPLRGARLDDVTVGIGGERYTVIGILPTSFRYLAEAGAWTESADIWLPLERETVLGQRTSHGDYHVVGRLAAGVDLAGARVQMNDLARTLKAQHLEPSNADAVLLTPLKDVVVRSAREPLQLLLYAGLGVLLVSCLNLATAVLAQGLARLGELRIRRALGATRLQLAAHLLAGAAALTLPGTLFGLLLAALSIRILEVNAAGSWPRLDEVGLDAAAVGTAVLVAGLTAILAGMVPAILLSGSAGTERLRSRGGSRSSRDSRLWTGFVSAQVSLTLLLLAGTGLLVRSFMEAARVDLGYNPRGVLALDVTLPGTAYRDAAVRHGYYERALAALRAVPAVEAVGITNVLPQDTSAYTSGTRREGTDAPPVMAGYRLVDRGYLDVLGVPRLQGDEGFEKGGVLVDRRLAELLWKGAPPVGDRILNGFAAAPGTVVGVVGTIREWDQGQNTIGAIYDDFRRHPRGLLAMHLVARYRGDAAAVAATARRALQGIDPLVPVAIAPLDARVEAALDGRRLFVIIAIGFGVAALLLAAASVYAMIAFAVGRQLREAAIRLALGAQPSALSRRVLKQALMPAAIGSLLGLALCVPMGRAIRAQLFQVEPADPLVLGAATLAILVASVLASAAPARRTSRVDPATALRDE